MKSENKRRGGGYIRMIGVAWRLKVKEKEASFKHRSYLRWWNRGKYIGIRWQAAFSWSPLESWETGGDLGGARRQKVEERTREQTGLWWTDRTENRAWNIKRQRQRHLRNRKQKKRQGRSEGFCGYYLFQAILWKIALPQSLSGREGSARKKDII